MRHADTRRRNPLRAAAALSLCLCALLLTPTLHAASTRTRGSHAARRVEPAPRAVTHVTAPDDAAATPARRPPLSFVPNAARLDATVLYEARTSGATIHFKRGGADFSLAGAGARLRLRFLGASEHVAVEAAEPLPGTFNHFAGPDPARWRAGLKTFGRLHYRQLYRGIDLAYDGAGGTLKSTYTVAPGRDPGALRWRYDGATRVEADPATGDLRVFAGAARAGRGSDAPALVERAPVAWQEGGGARTPVPVRYRVEADGTIGFEAGAYDPARALVIDPAVEFSYYVGGQGRDYGYAVALDRQGNIYLAGSTTSVNFPPAPALALPAQPLHGGKSDAFVVKLSPDGATVLYSTYLGGSDDDCAFGLAVDAAGGAYVAGYTQSADFPAASALRPTPGGGESDAFVARLSPTGSRLVYSTYLGGAGEDAARAVSVDAAGAAYVAGYTASADFPTARALQPANAGEEDAFVAKLSADGRALSFSTYLGGGASDYGEAVAVDAAGAAHVAGYTRSPDFPARHARQPEKSGHEDAFALKLRPDGGDLAYSTYVGGSDTDHARALSLDRWGNAYVAGTTRSADFPTADPLRGAHAGGDDAFVVKLRPNGHVRYATYLGGGADDYALGAAADARGYVTVTGRTKSSDFPTADAPKPSISADADDAFAARLTPDGRALHFSTYVGGNDREIGEAVALDAAGNTYLTGYTFSSDFPNTRVEPWRGFLDEDVFVQKVGGPTPTPAPCAARTNVAGAAAGSSASASSVYPSRDYSPAGAIDGDRAGSEWEQGGGWNDATRDLYPDWLQVDFADVRAIDEVRVYTLQDDFLAPVDPGAGRTATLYGLRDFDVQVWDGSAWVTVPGGAVRANDLAARSVAFPLVETTAVRLRVLGARAGFSRVVELEALGCSSQ